MPSQNIVLVIGVPQILPAVGSFRSLQNIGAGKVCVTLWNAAAVPPGPAAGVGQYLKPDSIPGLPPNGDGGIWDSIGENWPGELRVETFGAGSTLAEEAF